MARLNFVGLFKLNKISNAIFIETEFWGKKGTIWSSNPLQSGKPFEFVTFEPFASFAKTFLQHKSNGILKILKFFTKFNLTIIFGKCVHANRSFQMFEFKNSRIARSYQLNNIWTIFNTFDSTTAPSAVFPHPAIQHAFPPVSASVDRQAALTHPSPHGVQS